MAKGTERRQGATDSLVGASEITPVIPQAPVLQIPNASVPDVTNNMSAQVMRAVQGFASKQFQAQANVEHEASVLDGQMAYQQGKAMEDIEVPGDKWAMHGYRVMNAQTTASTMLAAQQEMITQSQYEQDPDAFRATYVNRLEQQLAGLDPQTAKMVREQMSTHMPSLVAQHTTAYMKNEEQKNFDALAAQVGVLSKDPTPDALNALLNNAGGTGAAAGLSPDRVSAALVQGVADAFNDGNPLAYQAMMASGAFDNLPAAERERVRGAKLRYENMARSQVDGDFLLAQRNLQSAIEAGEYTGKPADLTDAMTALYASEGMEIRGGELGAAYILAAKVGDIDSQTEYLALQASIASGDIQKVVAGTTAIIDQHDAGAVRANEQAEADGALYDNGLIEEFEGYRDIPYNDPRTDSTGTQVGPNIWRSGYGSSTYTTADGKVHRVTKEYGGTKEDARRDLARRHEKEYNPRIVAAIGQDAFDALAPHQLEVVQSLLHNYGSAAFGSSLSGVKAALQDGDPMKVAAEIRALERHNGGINRGRRNKEADVFSGVAASPRRKSSAGWLVTPVPTPGAGGAGVAWSDNVARYNGDVEAAALAHRTDQDTADAWLSGGKSWSGIDVSVRDYVKGVMNSVNGGDLPQTAEQRLSISQSKLKAAQALRKSLMEEQHNQATMTAEAELTDRMRFAEKQLMNGDMNGSQYRAVYDRKRAALGLVRTAGSQKHIAASIDAGITQAAERAKAAGDEQAANNLYAYQGIQASLTATMEHALENAQTVEEAETIGTIYQKTSIAAAQEFGLDIKKTGINKQHSEVQAKIFAEQDRIEQIAVDAAAAQAAIDAGIADSQTGATSDAVDKVLSESVTTTLQQNTDPVNPENSMTLPEAQLKVWGEAGTVPSDAKTMFSASVNGPMVVDGNPTPDAMYAFDTFKQLRQNGSHRAANSMFDDEARLRMEAVIATAAGGLSANPEQVGTAMLALDERRRDMRTQDDLPDARSIGKALTTNQIAVEAVEEFLDVNTVDGGLERWFTSSGRKDRNTLTWRQTKAALSEESVDNLTQQIEDRYLKLQALNSGARSETIAGLAAEQILDEVSVIGDSIVSMNQGSGIKRQMFGDNDFSSTPLVEHRAISGYIKMMAETQPDLYGHLTGTTVLERSPDVLKSLWGFVTGARAELSQEEALDIAYAGGVRPFNVDEGDGVNATLSVLDRDGQREMLDSDLFSMERIGQWYMETEHQRLLDANPTRTEQIDRLNSGIDPRP
jgi:GH24 family phage-related lysozyme (muramidase)